MKFATFIFAFAFGSLTACSHSENANNSSEFSSQFASMADQNGTTVHTITNPQTGQAVYQISLPSSWKLDQNQGLITGPNGLEIRQFQGVSNMYANDPYTQQSYAAMGKQMLPPIGAQGVLQQDLQQKAQQMGLTYQRAFAVPSLAQKDRAYSDQLVSYGNPQKRFDVLATEWKSNDGKQVMILIHYYEQASMGMSFWGYHYKALSASPADYEGAKAQYIRGLEGIRHNQAAIQAYNQQESQTLQQRDAAFQNRMRSNQANFDATQRAYTESQNAINQSQMSIYQSQSESFNRGNQQITNGIYEENTLYNPTIGEYYQVQDGYNNYWMNSEGEYIGTDDQFYNPNTDPNINNTEWQQGQNPK